MRSGTLLGLGAACAVVLTVVALERLRLPHTGAANAAAAIPVATPPGITMQVAEQAAGAGGSSAPQIVFADAKGMTLYAYAGESPGGGGTPAVLACVGNCLKTWRPALAAHDPDGATDWSVLERADGSKQWCYRGAPLYAFAGDEAPGEIKGQGSGGGAWRAAAFVPDVGTVLPDAITVRHLPDAGGTALVTLEGMTLYAFEQNPAHPLAGCGAGPDCARPWRPFEAAAIASPAGDFTVIARPDGITQWAFRSHPLYLFEADRKPGEVRGIGVDAHFHVALMRRYFMPAGAAIRPITGLGNALVTRGGATLYERDRVQPGEDNHDFHDEHGPPALGRWYGTSTCDASCAKTWPPYAAPTDAVASGYWDVLTRADGVKQWAYKGFALYRYSGDAPGEARGHRQYELVRIDAVGPAEQGAGTSATPFQLSARDEAAYVRFAAKGNASGIGVGALFWHAVVP
jgi:predicted lipoprotein with Yx(FWY)xxD motif